MRRAVLIVLFALLLAGCGGEKVVSPTGPVEGTTPGTTTTTGETTTTAAKGDPAAGKKVFTDSGCGSCHTFAPAGSNGQIGPELGEVLKGKSPDFIKESIVDPNAEVASGFQPGIMPPDYGSQLTPTQIADLVSFLQQGT